MGGCASNAAMNPIVSSLRRVALVLVSLAAVCASAEPSPAVSRNPPGFVDQPLVPPTNDTPTAQPSPQHVWIPGHWHWGQGSYVWVAGHWEIPPVPAASWMAPQWQPQGNAFFLREGYWQEGAPEPAVASGAAQPPTEISTVQTPPAPKAEAVPPQPAPDFVWQPGYWDWRDNQFVWINGRWEQPSRPNVTWMPTHWEKRADRWVLTAGYWRDNTSPTYAASSTTPTQVIVTPPPPPTQVIVVPPSPPPPQPEVIYTRPSRYDIWVPGYWSWRYGRYVWVPGHWDRPPRGHHRWEPAHWERRGGISVFIEGHWR